MKMVLKPMLAAALCLALLTAVGCTTYAAIMFDVETGDSIKVTLDTSDSNGFKLIQSDGTFTVSKDGATVSQGAFLTEEMYADYLDAVSSNPDVTILTDASAEENPYIFYTVTGDAGEEYNYILWINDSSTGVIIASLADQASAEQVFSCLSFEAE